MRSIKLKKGLNIPITGSPKQIISDSKPSKKVAVIGEDYVGMKPTMLVNEGDNVKLGQVLFEDKKLSSIKYTAPGAGKVLEINRGEKRKFLSIVLELAGQDEITFQSFPENQIDSISKEQIIGILLQSGEWTAIRQRPFSKVADPSETPHSIFVTTMDTNPLAPDIEKIIAGKENYFKTGLKLISKLTGGKLFIGKTVGSEIPTIDSPQIEVVEFSGPHPSGLVGTHIHFLDPVSRKKTVWYLTTQDVIAIGALFISGKIYTERVVALCGPQVKEARLVRTRRGADLTELLTQELKDGENRIISGSVLSGRSISKETCYLGRFHQQVSVIAEERERKFLGWLSPGTNLYSMKNIVLSSLFRKKKFDFTTALHGGKRSIVPNGNFEAVIPMDILPTYLLRALAVNDIEEAEQLGALELDEEDLALCTFSCPSKLDYGPMLRENLTIIEKEG